MDKNTLAGDLGALAVFVVAVLMLFGVVVVIPAGGAIILAELSGGSAKPHCSNYTWNRSCVRPATTAKALSTKAERDAAAKRFRELYPTFRPMKSETKEDVLGYRPNRSLRDGRPLSFDDAVTLFQLRDGDD